jgi:Lrp/AsnC family transcriptional regulator
MAEGLSRLDVRLLEELQKDATLSTMELADRIGSSQSSCWRRLQRLKDEGYIRAQVVLLDEARLAPGIYMYLRLGMSQASKQDRDALLRTIEITPEVVECYWTFGEMDLLMKVLAPDMGWFRNFVIRLRDLKGVRDSDTIVTMAEVKRTTAIPLRESE